MKLIVETDVAADAYNNENLDRLTKETILSSVCSMRTKNNKGYQYRDSFLRRKFACTQHKVNNKMLSLLSIYIINTFSDLYSSWFSGFRKK